MIKSLLFIKTYWKSIAIVSLLLAGISTVVFLYQDNLSLESEKAIAEVGFKECQAISANLVDRLESLNKDLQKLEDKRDELEAQVSESRLMIKDIQSERDNLLFELERERNIPDDCEGKFQWLVQEFQKIRETYYE